MPQISLNFAGMSSMETQTSARTFGASLLCRRDLAAALSFWRTSVMAFMLRGKAILAFPLCPKRRAGSGLW